MTDTDGSFPKEDGPQPESRPSEVPTGTDVPEAKGSPLSETGSEEFSPRDEANMDDEEHSDSLERNMAPHLRKRKRKMKHGRVRKTASGGAFNAAFSEDLQQLRYFV